jgi:hypothetical protein
VSRGFGRVQRRCLEAVETYTSHGEDAPTFTIAADVFSVQRDPDGNRLITNAQYAAVKRALAGLQRKGLVVGQRHPERSMKDADGRPNGKCERSKFWTTPGS